MQGFWDDLRLREEALELARPERSRHPRYPSPANDEPRPDGWPLTAREADADLNKLALRARLAVIGAGRLDAATLDTVYSKLIERATGDGHVANGAAKILLDLARATVEVPTDDPDHKPLEELTPEERIALFVRLDKRLREEAGDEIEPGDGDQADPAKATSPPTGRSPRV
jgi:hypothetical protein